MDLENLKRVTKQHIKLNEIIIKILVLTAKQKS